MPHFQVSRPRYGACLLDFYDVWLWQAIRMGDTDRAYEYARAIGHWALAFHPELKPPTGDEATNGTSGLELHHQADPKTVKGAR